MLKVHFEGYEDLTEEEKERVPNNGCGKKYANYVRVTHGMGKTVLLMSDAIEPEDASLTRDYRPLAEFIEKAYLLGVKDGKKLVK